MADYDDAPPAATRAALGLSQLVPDALEDSHVAAYSLLVVAPLCALAARLLRARGKATTFPHVLLVALLVPGLLLGAPAVCCEYGADWSLNVRVDSPGVCMLQWYKWQHGEWSVYRLLQVRSPRVCVCGELLLLLLTL